MGTKISVFPKFLKKAGSGSEEAGILASLGFPTADLLIRKGYAVDVQTTDDNFDRVVAQYHSAGIALHSAITDLNEPDSTMPRIVAACSRNGIASIKIGPYKYEDGRYQQNFNEARRKLDGLAELAAKQGVQILVQLHGNTIHSSASLGRKLVEGFDPKQIGIYWDPGNMMHLDGHEKWTLGLEIVGPYLAYIGVKNVAWVKSGQVWETEWSLLDKGIIPWPEVIRSVRGMGYKGGYCLHNFYVNDWAPSSTEMIKKDLAYLKGLLSAE